MKNAILLDTNALLWVIDPTNSKLGTQAKELISESDYVYVSAVSILEIQIKSMLGKLKAPENLLQSIEKSNLKSLEISAEHASAISLFPGLVKHDPFDRLLLAQAVVENLTFLTADTFLLEQIKADVHMCNAGV